MKSANPESATTQAANVVPITIAPKPKPVHEHQRFAVLEFPNRSGTRSWRSSGYKRDGARIRENFAEAERARCRQIELETEYLAEETETAIRATKLTQEQLQMADVAIIKLGEDWPSLVSAADYWLSHGKHSAVPESPGWTSRSLFGVAPNFDLARPDEDEPSNSDKYFRQFRAKPSRARHWPRRDRRLSRKAGCQPHNTRQ